MMLDHDETVARGAELLGRGLVTDAAACFESVLDAAPAHAAAKNNLAHALQLLGQPARAMQLYRELIAATSPPLQWRIASNYLVSLQYQDGLSPQALKAQALQIAALMGDAQPLAAPARPPHAPLRVGFMSPDLCDHPVGLFLLPLLKALDRGVVEPVLFCLGGREDMTTGELRALAEWHDIRGMDTARAVAWLRRHALDVMVDLAGHTAGNGLPILARRVAPLQISWLGYFATTGLTAMDAVLMDRWHVPDGQEAFFSERVVRLPGSRFCYQSAPFAPDVAPPPALRRGFVTFGSFNNSAKYNPVVFDAWAAILRAVPRSRLLLKWASFADPQLCTQVQHEFVRRGIEPERLELRPASFHRDLLAQYSDMDIALDPFPFSGGHTSCEALWMGLPVVTLPGDRPVSRQTLGFVASLNHPRWLQEWVAADLDDYVRKAVALAGDPTGLAAIRSSLRGTLAESPLMDAGAFARDWAQAVCGLAGRR